MKVPALRKRREDIPLLTRYFVQKYAQRMGRAVQRIPKAAFEALTNYGWPGKIRELQNVVERSVVLSDGPEQSAPLALSDGVSDLQEEDERALILQALKDTGGVVGGATGAAARLGLKRTTLQSRMRKFNITRLYH